MAFVTVIQFVLIVGVVVYLTVNMLHLVRVTPIPGPLSSSPLVSVCVPARDEERDVGACLDSLLKQDYPQFEVIAVDDNSTDSTADIIRNRAGKHPNLVFLSGKILPQDWFGKPYALHQAFQKARGEYLLFTDADPVFRPLALTSAMDFMIKNELDVLTLMPGAVFGSFWERVIQPVVFGFIAALTRFKKINSAEHRNSMGIGAFILIKREVYQAIGGHQRVKQKIVEDIELVKNAKRNGFKIAIADGKDIFFIRMYHSLREIWQGWKKNLFIAMNKSVSRTLYYMAVIPCFMVTPYFVLFCNLWAQAHFVLTGLSFLGLIMVLTAKVKLCRELRLNEINILLLPLGAIMISMLLFHSMIQIQMSGHSQWRGRNYIEEKS